LLPVVNFLYSLFIILYIASQAAYRSCSGAFCVTDRAGVQPIGRRCERVVRGRTLQDRTLTNIVYNSGSIFPGMSIEHRTIALRLYGTRTQRQPSITDRGSYGDLITMFWTSKSNACVPSVLRFSLFVRFVIAVGGRK